MQTSFVGGGGIRLAAEGAGEPTAPAVLLFHGGGQTRHAWGSAVGKLAAAGWQAWSVDMRGHGDSDWSPDGEYTIDVFASDVAAVASEFDRPSLVGASLGGISALTAVGEGLIPGASSLVLVDITPRFEVEGARRVHAFMAKGVDGFASLDDVAAAIHGYLPHRRRPPNVDGLHKNLRHGDDGRWYWHWDPRFLRLSDDTNEIRPLATEERLVDASSRVRIPTLLVRGALSDVVSDNGADDLKQLIPHAEVATVGGAGHMVAGDQNDAFNDTIIDFLERHRP